MSSISQIVPAIPQSANREMIGWATELDANLRSMFEQINEVFDKLREIDHRTQIRIGSLNDEIAKLKQEIDDLQRTE